MFTKKSLLISLAVCMAICLAFVISGCSSNAENDSEVNFPEQPVTLVVPYGAGGGTDVIARKVASLAERSLGETITVVNKPGGVTAPAMLEISQSKPDGYNLLVVSTPLVTLRHINDDITISYEDFEPIVGMNEDLYCISVLADSEFNSVQDIVDFAKEHPGELKIGAAGPGGTFYMSVLSFLDATGIDAKIVPHPEGVNAIRTALLGNHVDVIAVGVGDILEFVKGKQIKVLAVAGNERNSYLPDVPTLKEEGIDAVPVSTFRGIVGPKGMPEEVVETLHSAFKEALESQELVDFMESSALDVMYLSPSDWYNYLKESDDLFGSLADLYKALN
ncbi:MAG: tripartite tricarboxylate transporter substrate binding protein [Bacillota bacterium]|jgi:tripartite-type tricarboxylate transporter receptor subunit TctC